MTPETTTDWYSDETATLGDRIAGGREVLGIGQEELARQIGVRLDTLRKWEDDRAEPRANRVQMLAGILGVSLSWLLTGKGEGPDAPVEAAPPAEVTRILDEMRRLHGQIARANVRLGQLEKALRRRLREV